MKKLPHLNSIKKHKLTFMIIPNSTDKIIEFTVPTWVPKLAIGGILFSITLTIFSTSTFLNTKNQLDIASAKILELQNENHQQINEIATLNLRSAKIEEQLLSLNELKNHVLDMVGLDSPQIPGSNEEDPLFLVSRSYQRSANSSEDYEEAMIQLEVLIEKQKDNMSQLVEDVEKQLEYLDALPNLMPANGRITSPFGYRISPINRRREFHKGMDIANKSNTDIVAAGAGIVTYSGYNGGYGRMIILSHGNGYTSVYAHNRENLVSVGQRVDKGQVISKMGSTGRSTGPHVHFEVRLYGEPMNPQELLETKN